MDFPTALMAADASTRLHAALAVGADPQPDLLPLLFERCAVEPDFYVRDMLTWAVTRYPVALTLPRLLEALGSDVPQARSQALHTLSKIREPQTWPAITRSLLRDPDDEVARSAWRAAVVLVPETQVSTLAEELATQLGRGGVDVQLSLSRALVALGEDVIAPLLARAMTSPHAAVQAHAAATECLLRDPDRAVESAVREAKRVVARGIDAVAAGTITVQSSPAVASAADGAPPTPRA